MDQTKETSTMGTYDPDRDIQDREAHNQTLGQQANQDNRHQPYCPICSSPMSYATVHREHWLYCSNCQVRYDYGSNMFSGWKDGAPAEGAENAAMLEPYRVLTDEEMRGTAEPA